MQVLLSTLYTIAFCNITDKEDGKISKILLNCLLFIKAILRETFLFQHLSVARQPLTYLDAVYFMRPNQANIKQIKTDFGEPRVRY